MIRIRRASVALTSGDVRLTAIRPFDVQRVIIARELA
tara:strand:+ start:321 stop:431 length:111 start_codon:yes stop_codon:yes gene_type:complete